MKPEEVLRQAAAEVDKGWCQGNLIDHQGHVCALGALRRVVRTAPGLGYVDDSIRHAGQVLAEVMAEQFGLAPAAEFLSLIARANDTPGRTKEEIIACMEKAAAKLEEQA